MNIIGLPLYIVEDRIKFHTFEHSLLQNVLRANE